MPLARIACVLFADPQQSAFLGRKNLPILPVVELGILDGGRRQMGELVAWGLGLGLGYTVRNSLTTRGRMLLFVMTVVLLGALITLLSGEIASEPWLVIVDIGQVALAALIGAVALPVALRWLRGMARFTVR
jgi:hypothetical protein